LWSRPAAFRRNLAAATAVSLAPLIGAGLWVVAYESLKPVLPIKTISYINVPSVFSAIFYQYTNLEVFDVWIHGPLRRHALSTIVASDLVLTLVAVCAIPFLIVGVMRAADPAPGGAQLSKRSGIKMGAFFVCMLALLLGAGAIYALGGGYSLDARKRYVILPLLLMTAAAGTWLIWGPERARAVWPRGGYIATTAICISGCLTSLLVLSIWKYELTRLNLLADLISEKKVSGNFQVNWNPDLTSIWPHAERSWGPSASWALTEALRARGHSGDIAFTPKSTQVISWNGDRQQWTLGTPH
jgi:hypothetical protein